MWDRSGIIWILNFPFYIILKKGKNNFTSLSTNTLGSLYYPLPIFLVFNGLVNRPVDFTFPWFWRKWILEKDAILKSHPTSLLQGKIDSFFENRFWSKICSFLYISMIYHKHTSFAANAETSKITILWLRITFFCEFQAEIHIFVIRSYINLF